MDDVDALLQGEWRNIGSVVQTTLRALTDVVKAQAGAIRALERQLEARPAREEVEAALADRPSVEDVNRALADVAVSMDRKVDRADIMPSLERQQASIQTLQGLVAAAPSQQAPPPPAPQPSVSAQVLQQEIDALRAAVERKPDRSELERYATRDFVSTKASVAELTAGLRENEAALRGKLDKDELAATVPRLLDTAIARKVDYDSLQTALRDVATRSEVAATVDTRMSELRQSVEAQVKFVQQVAEERSTHLSAAMDMRLAEVRHQLNAEAVQRAEISAVHSRPDLQEISRMMDSTAQASEVQQLLATKADKVEVTQLARSVCDRVSSAELTTQLQQNRDLVLRDVRQLLQRTQEEVVEALNKKAYTADVHRALQQKVGVEQLDEVSNELRACARVGELRDLQETVDRKADKEEVLRQLANKAEQADLLVVRQTQRAVGGGGGMFGGGGGGQSAIEDDATRAEVTALRKEVARKADLEAVESMLDTRPTVKAVNDILRQLTVELDSKASDETVAQVAADATAIYAEINTMKQHISSELSCARFIWKSGRTCEDRTVPWNLQVVNTNVDGFVWRKDVNVITCQTPGLYEISAGFFTAHEPTVQLLVDGEPILSSDAASEASPRSVRRGRHSAGCVTSVGFSHFFALPARAQVAVTYSADDGAQGFISLRKL